MMEVLVGLVAFGAIVWLVSPYLSRESPIVRYLLIAYSFAVTARYGFWRVSTVSALPLSLHAVLSYAFLGLELVSTYLALDVFCLLRNTANRSAEASSQLEWYGDHAPRIDILIATYNEPWEVLEKTLVGATSQRYPNYQVWILDDGNRPWLHEKAEALGLGYVTRTNNEHHKAGNLNHGIAELRRRGVTLEFVAILDADFIPRPEFLRRTAALMKSPDVGIVQTPQFFYNPDPHQATFGGVQNWPDEQRTWFDVYLPALDSYGWATCCGTSCLIRVAALDQIGGFPTASVCEDTLCSILMLGKGLRTAYLHERLSVGLAPEGIGEFLTQRARWITGGIQNTRHSGRPTATLARIKYWLMLWRLAIWGVLPPIWVLMCVGFWFTGVSLLQISTPLEGLSYFAPMWLSRLFETWLYRGRQQPFVSDAVWMLLAPFWVRETIRAVAGSKARFKVTDKAQHRDKIKVHWGLLPFPAALLTLLAAGMIYGLTDETAPTYHAGFGQANTLLTLWFACVIIAGFLPAVELPRRRMSDRYRTTETVSAWVEGEKVTWSCTNISLGGVCVRAPEGQRLPNALDLEVVGVGSTRAALVRKTVDGLAAFEFQDPQKRPALIRKIYCEDSYIMAPEGWSIVRGLASFAKRVLL